MRISLMLGFVLMASVVQAEFISWRVYIDTGNSFYDSAQLFATTTGTLNYETQSAQGGAISTYSGEDFGITPTDTALNVSGSSYSFFVALFNGASFVAYSELRTWDSLVGDGSIWSGGLPAPMGTTYWNAVPEPTSMGLLALGMSALLLRRRRRA